MLAIAVKPVIPLTALLIFTLNGLPFGTSKGVGSSTVAVLIPAEIITS